MNGIDVSKLKVGDVLELSLQDATMMIEEGWAEEVAEADSDERMVETSRDLKRHAP